MLFLLHRIQRRNNQIVQAKLDKLMAQEKAGFRRSPDRTDVRIGTGPFIAFVVHGAPPKATKAPAAAPVPFSS